MLATYLLAATLGSVLAVPNPDLRSEEPKCGYESCTKTQEGILNVHIVPHTHDDVGWLKTVDQYYYGYRNDIQKAGVQYILDSVIKELWEDPERRFIYVETAYLVKWWEEQSQATKDRVHTLVREGRLKFVGGAWSMNDEANTYYQSTIDQFTFGLSFLNRTFGECGRPRVGWQIDPFGHSREFASLLAAMGYDGLFLGRIDYQDKAKRLKDKTMEFIWRGDDNLGKSSDIFTGVLYNTYSPPPGFCFDVLCNDAPIVDDPESGDYNVDERVAAFINISQHMAAGYRTNNILVTMGEDFQYQEAGMWYKNLDKLIKRGYGESRVGALYLVGDWLATSHYFGALNRPSFGRCGFMCNQGLPKALLNPVWDSERDFMYVTDFLAYVKQMGKAYVTNNVLVTMGGDFTYQDAGMWYKNLDKLIKYTNKKAQEENLNITLFYSTPDCYLKAVKDANPKLPLKQDDFFPYASDPHSYWTGYFTSRPTVKFLEAEANRYFQVAKQLYVLADLPKKHMKVLDKLKSAMGIMQHHDAVTGTEKQHVTYDYIKIISKALRDVHDTITTEAMNKLILGPDSKYKLKFDRCQFNESSCATSENAEGNLIITVYNPLAWATLTAVSIPVKEDHRYELRGSDGKWHYAQTAPLSSAAMGLPSRRSSAAFEVVFTDTIPALGYKSYYMRKVAKTKRDLRRFEKFDQYDNVKRHYDRPMEGNRQFSYDDGLDDILEVNSDNIVKRSADEPVVVERYPYDKEFGDEDVTEGIDVSAGTLKTVLVNDKSFQLRGTAAYYRGFLGNNKIFNNRSSGAYIFRPEYNTPVRLRIYNSSSISGDVFSEGRVSMSGNVDFAFRTYKDLKIKYGELDWIVGPILDVDGVGKEYIFRYDSNLITNGEIYTDSNGRQMLKRILNKRPQWNLTVEEPVSSNYYPLVDFAYIKDANEKFTVGIIPDRPEGGASLQEGAIEVMLHRRLFHDDAFGVGEALNETLEGKGLVVRGTHRVFFGTTDLTFKDVLEMRNRPQVFVSDASDVDINIFSTFNTEKSALDSLPDGVHLLTLEPWQKSSLLIRFENYLDKSEKSSKTVDLEKVLKGVSIKSFKETLLSADRFVDKYEKWVWEADGEFADDINAEYGTFGVTARAVDRVRRPDDGKKITLDAKEIRTFIVEYEFSE